MEVDAPIFQSGPTETQRGRSKNTRSFGISNPYRCPKLRNEPCTDGIAIQIWATRCPELTTKLFSSSTLTLKRSGERFDSKSPCPCGLRRGNLQRHIECGMKIGPCHGQAPCLSRSYTRSHRLQGRSRHDLLLAACLRVALSRSFAPFPLWKGTSDAETVQARTHHGLLTESVIF